MKLFDNTKDIIILILILSIVVFLVPYWYVTGSWGWIDYTDSGAIGDTVGGITAPFINSIAAVLVYLAFRAQIKANELLKNQQYLPYLEGMVEKLDNNRDFKQYLNSFNTYVERYSDDDDKEQYKQYFKRVKYITSLIETTNNQTKDLKIRHLEDRLNSIFEIHYYDLYIKILDNENLSEFTLEEVALFNRIRTLIKDLE